VHGIGAEPRLIPEIDVATRCFGLPGNRRELLALPCLDRGRVTLISGFCGVSPSLASNAPTAVTPNRMWNFRSISSATKDRVHNPKSRPY
jgi:hypothetical protein